MRDRAIRPWCAEAQFPGLAPFMLGTVILPHDAQTHEIEAALAAHARTFLPDGFRIIAPVAGAIFFQAEDQP
jgi:hypothetical protein